MTPKDVLLAWVKAFNKQDADALFPCTTQRRSITRWQLGDPAVGREAIIRDARKFFAAYPDTFTRVETLSHDGDVEWT